MKQFAIGIDLGGTNIKGIVMNHCGESSHITRVPTQAHLGGSHIMENILELIRQLIDKHGDPSTIAGVGIGTPGFIGANGAICGGAKNLPGWEGTQVFAPIVNQFGLAAYGTNDATAMALAEGKYGAGSGKQNVVFFTLGTGIGGGVITNGHVYQGAGGRAGELGHIVVETNGLPCTCGMNGCVEQYASATGIVQHALWVCRSHDEPAFGAFAKAVQESPESVTAKLVYDYAKKGDSTAIAINEYICERLARAVGAVLNTLAPDRVVLGGGVMMAGQIIVDTVSRHARHCCWPDIFDRCDIVAAELGEDAGAMGAAALVFENE